MFISDERWVGGLIEHFEIHKQLGIEQIFLYDTIDVRKNITRVLNYYHNLNFLTIVPWKIPLPNGSIFYFGQWAHILDCLYQNMHQCSYMGFWDIDEGLIPIKHETIPNMLDAIQFHIPSLVFVTP